MVLSSSIALQIASNQRGFNEINSDKEQEQKNNMMGKNLSIATICLLVLLASTVHANVFDVKTYGAQPNADITQVCIGQIGIKIFYITFAYPYTHFYFS